MRRPPGTELTERNGSAPAWESLDEDTRLLYAHLQAAFAGFLEHTDAQLGRIVDELETLGIADDTIVVVLSDNGASREGATGDIDTNAPYSRVTRPASDQLPHLDEVGSITAGSFYPEGWAMAGNTPFRRYKQFVDLGGVRSPLIMSWPGHIDEVGRVQNAFAHAVDIAPTILELAGLSPLDDTDGASLAPGVTSTAPVTGRTRQSFEMLGHRAMWHEGWCAVTEHRQGDPYEEDTWRLYHTTADFSHAHDLAAQYPDKVAQLQEMWWEGASRNAIMPLDDRTLIELLYARNPRGLLGQESFTLRPGQGHVPFPSAVCGSNRAMVVRADLVNYRPGADGALIASGNAASGYTLYVLDGRLHFEHHFLGERVHLTAPTALTAGSQQVGFALGQHVEGAARVFLFQDDAVVSRGEVPRTSGHLSFFGLDVGRDPVSPVSLSYEAPFAFPADQLGSVTARFNEEVDLEELASVRAASE